MSHVPGASKFVPENEQGTREAPPPGSSREWTRASSLTCLKDKETDKYTPRLTSVPIYFPPPPLSCSPRSLSHAAQVPSVEF